MRKILLVSGCSYTDKNFKSDFHPDIDVSWPKWPAILGKKLDMDVINHGYCGSGNEYIYNSLINHLAGGTENIGLVIAGWTRVPRRDFKVGERRFNIRWDNHGDMKYFQMKTLMYQYSLQEVCKSLNVPHKQIHILDPYESAVAEQTEMYGEDKHLQKQEWSMNNPYMVNQLDRRYTRKDAIRTLVSSPYYNAIDEKTFIGWPVEQRLGGFCAWDKLDEDKHFVSELDRHPNRIGQEIIAELIHENL
tara:strand:+ start:65 stop:805 length:741 start_codon:yes stop_codon:yes gene_type:complete